MNIQYVDKGLLFINFIIFVYLFLSDCSFIASHFCLADGEDSTVSIQIKLENEGSDEELETDILYSPQIALKLALTEWLIEFGVPHQYNSNCLCVIFFNMI